MFGTLPYIPGVESKNLELLSRYLPPIPDGVISTWLKKNIAPGSWVLDPFCASPRLSVEAARAGYRILVTANNPIARYLLEMAANPPKLDDLKSTLAELAASYKGDERIEPHIRSLYNTHCARCGQIVSAEAFLWEHGNPSPYMRIYTCPFCGDTGEHPCSPFDVEQANQIPSGGLHKARALERVVASNDQDRIHVEQALSVYIPRALYALITIINKMEGLNTSPISQKHLAALLLYAFDQANALWRVPGPRERRRQLIIPRHFRENNIWLALEQGIDLWNTDNNQEINQPLPVSIWPKEPPASGGICIYEGRLVSIADSLSGLNIKSVCAAIPRPNQAFWTLSALWAGWLWGREAVGTFKSVLHRQRYDWGWHTTALSSVFRQIANILDPSTYIFGLIGEAEPGFIAAALVAAGLAGCGLEGMAILSEEEQAQIVWRCKNKPETIIGGSGSMSEIGIQSAKRFLEIRGEPASYLNTISAAFMNIIQVWTAGLSNTTSEKKNVPTPSDKKSESTDQSEPTPSLVYSTIYNSAREALTFRSGFLRFNLQDILNIDTSNKNQIVQDTLFSLDLGKINKDDTETGNAEPVVDESESTYEKERPTRSSDISESVLLWLRDTDHVNHFSITDSYEMAFVNYLSTHPDFTKEDINLMMCELFTGLFTPDPEIIHLCLEAYCEKDLIDENHWHIRPEDMPGARQNDLESAYRYIHQIGDRLGFLCKDQIIDNIKSAISWLDEIGDLDFWFFPTVSAAIGESVLYNEISPRKGFIVLPGSRANLVAYKLSRDPRLSKAFHPIQGNWGFLKFRHLRSLVENPLLNRENLDQLLRLDPLTYTTPQLRLI